MMRLLSILVFIAVTQPSHAFALSVPRRLTVLLNVYDYYLIANEDSSSIATPWVLAFKVSEMDTHLVSVIPSAIPASDGQCRLVGSNSGSAHSDVVCALKFSEAELLQILQAKDPFYRTFRGDNGTAVGFTIQGRAHSIAEVETGIIPAVPDTALTSGDIRQHLPRVRFSESPIILACGGEVISSSENGRQVSRKMCQLRWKHCGQGSPSLCSRVGFVSALEVSRDFKRNLYASLISLSQDFNLNAGGNFPVSMAPVEQEKLPPLPSRNDFCFPTISGANSERLELALADPAYPAPFDLALKGSDGAGHSTEFSRTSNWFRPGSDAFEIERVQLIYQIQINDLATAHFFEKAGGFLGARFTPKVCNGARRWLYCSAGELGQSKNICSLRGALLRQKCDTTVPFTACTYSSANFGGDASASPPITRPISDEIKKRGSLHLELVDSDLVATICPPNSSTCSLYNASKDLSPAQHMPATGPVNIEDRLRNNPKELERLVQGTGATILWTVNDCFQQETPKEAGCE